MKTADKADPTLIEIMLIIVLNLAYNKIVIKSEFCIGVIDNDH